MKGILWQLPGGKPGWSEESVVIPSAGSGEVARYAAQEGHEVYIADLNCARGELHQRIEEALELFSERTSQKRPDFSMLTGMTCKADNNAEFANYLKERFEDSPIIMGGTHVSGIRAGMQMAEEREIEDGGLDLALSKLEEARVDYLYSGEAINVGNLLSAISGDASRNDLREIEGISYREEGRWIHNQRHLDSTLELGEEALKESPVWENYLFGFDKTHLWGMGPAFPFRITKGCNMNCPFCSAMAVNPDEGFKRHIPYTPLDLEHSLEEFGKLLKMGANLIFSTDENPLQQYKGRSPGREFLEEIIDRGWNKEVKLGMMTSAEATADPRNVELMKEANVIMAQVGYESLTDPKNLGKRRVDMDISYQSIQNLRKGGIMNFDAAIVGGFGDDRESIRRELNLRADLGLAVTLVQPLQPYFGTRTRIEAIEKGLIRNDGREDNGLGGFGGMHGEMIASLATEKGLEPIDVTEAIVSAQRRNASRVATNLLRSNYMRHIRGHLLERAIGGIPTIPKRIVETGVSDREIAKRKIERAIEYNRLEF